MGGGGHTLLRMREWGDPIHTIGWTETLVLYIVRSLYASLNPISQLMPGYLINRRRNQYTPPRCFPLGIVCQAAIKKFSVKENHKRRSLKTEADQCIIKRNEKKYRHTSHRAFWYFVEKKLLLILSFLLLQASLFVRFKIYRHAVNFDPVTTALTFIRVTYDPEGDGEEAGLHLTLIKVKSDVQNNISYLFLPTRIVVLLAAAFSSREEHLLKSHCWLLVKGHSYLYKIVIPVLWKKYYIIKQTWMWIIILLNKFNFSESLLSKYILSNELALQKLLKGWDLI